MYGLVGVDGTDGSEALPDGVFDAGVDAVRCDAGDYLYTD